MKSRMFFGLAWILFAISIYIYMESKRSPSSSFYPVEPYKVRYISNYDGDTIRVHIDGFPDIIGKNIPIRIADIDTPEMKSKNGCEKSRARKAKEFIRTRMLGAGSLEIKNVQRGKYFRLVADVYADGINLGQELLKSALAAPYDGGKKVKIDWCLPLQNVKTPN